MSVSARLFFIAGIVFMIVAIVADKIAVFLPIGMGLLFIGIMGIHRSRKSDDARRGKGSA